MSGLNSSFSVQHNVILYPQPTEMTCWSAASTMILGSKESISSGRASTGASGGLKPSPENLVEFAQSYGFRLYYPQSWSVQGLFDLLRKAPFAMLGARPRLHAVVIGGIRGGGTLDSVELTVYDPAPPNIGDIRYENYSQLMQKFPVASMYILQKR